MKKTQAFDPKQIAEEWAKTIKFCRDELTKNVLTKEMREWYSKSIPDFEIQLSELCKRNDLDNNHYLRLSHLGR